MLHALYIRVVLFLYFYRYYKTHRGLVMGKRVIMCQARAIRNRKRRQMYTWTYKQYVIIILL